MSNSAWFWTVFIILIYWVLPIALFCYHPDRSGEVTDEWGAIPYEKLKFNNKLEIAVIIGICGFTSWIVWGLIRLGILVWR